LESTFNNWYKRKMRKTEELSAETDLVEELFPNISTIAIVGISRNRHRDSHFVGRYLKNAGYNIVPVNPAADEILGVKTFPNLESIPFPVDIVDIFRKPEDIPEAIDEALNIHPKAVWLQLGTGRHPGQKAKVEEQGVRFIQNRCIKVDHQFLIRPKEAQINGNK